jgi:DNA polymerase III epsilon subunit-like protein
MQVNIMFDLETLGTDPGAAIIQLAAVPFDDDGYVSGGAFFATIDLQSCLDAGLTVTADTLDWWATRGGFRSPQRGMPIQDALLQFEEWTGRQESGEVWAHGAAFDASVLQSAYRRVLRRNAPWAYHRTLDLRTLLHVAGKEYCTRAAVRSGQDHNALDDCHNQIRLWKVAMKRIKMSMADE